MLATNGLVEASLSLHIACALLMKVPHLCASTFLRHGVVKEVSDRGTQLSLPFCDSQCRMCGLCCVCHAGRRAVSAHLPTSRDVWHGHGQFSVYPVLGRECRGRRERGTSGADWGKVHCKLSISPYAGCVDAQFSSRCGRSGDFVSAAGCI